jgi:hypothetical protein
VIRCRFLAACLALFVTVAGVARAQTPTEARLTVTVLDQTGGVLPTAVVTVTGPDGAAPPVALKPVVASDKGIAVFEKLAPGTYTIKGEFTQFAPTVLPNIRVKAGDNKQTLILALKKMEDSVTVTEDKQTAASDRAANTFGTTVSTDQVQALADDPTELQRQIQNMAGPDAVIRVDGFEGAPLPPKSQIKAIHITRDQFAAENHFAGGVFIDIVTQPGIGPAHGGVNLNEENGALDGRNPLFQSKGPLNNEFGNFNYGQSLAKNRADFAIAVNQTSSYTTPLIYQATANGILAQVLPIRAPSIFHGGNLQFNYALSPDQTLKIYANMNSSTSDNQGVGGLNSPDRAFTSNSTNKNFRLQEAGPLGRRFFMNTRILLSDHGQSNVSVLNAPTVVVEGDLTQGGAQTSGGSTQRGVQVQSDIDYIHGIHTVRFGTQLQGSWFTTNANTNYLGTFTYTSQAAFAADTPAFFTQNLGNPLLSYQYFQGGLYAQDDIRVRKSLTISAGVRYEVQNHSTDHNGIGPRGGVTWAPFKNGHTTLRASAGIFYDWIAASAFESTLRFNGESQDQINIVDPAFDPSTFTGTVTGGTTFPTGLDLFGPNLQLARTTRFSGAISQDLTKRINIGVVYAHNHADDQLSGVNLNTPVNGVLPNADFTTIMQAQSIGTTIGYSVQTNMSIAFSPPSPDLNKARFNWKRGGFYLYYRYAKSDTDALGAFTPSPTGTLTSEWGPSSNDIRHITNVSVYSNALKNLNVNLFLNAQTGAPYTETTGLQDTNDFLFDLRPAGVGRNTLRMPGQWDLSASVSYTFGFHKRTAPVPGQVGFSFNNGQISAQTFAADPNRYHVSMGFYASNITNHANFNGFSGVLSSQLFGVPTGVAQMRTIAFFTNFRF